MSKQIYAPKSEGTQPSKQRHVSGCLRGWVDEWLMIEPMRNQTLARIVSASACTQ